MTRSQQVLLAGTGFLFIALGAFFLHAEMNAAVVHTKHVYVYAGLMGLGALLIAPSIIMQFIRTVVVAIPFSGRFGFRKEDEPIEKAPPGTPPGTPVPGAPVVVVATTPTDPKPGDV